jgi:hypothetical protein
MSLSQEDSMRELNDMVTGMKQVINNLRSSAVTAKNAFQSEVTRAQVNTEKVQSFTTELKDANKEIEDFLGATGSNFPTSEATITPHADINGVTVNPGAPKS